MLFFYFDRIVFLSVENVLMNILLRILYNFSILDISEYVSKSFSWILVYVIICNFSHESVISLRAFAFFEILSFLGRSARFIKLSLYD